MAEPSMNPGMNGLRFAFTVFFEAAPVKAICWLRRQ